MSSSKTFSAMKSWILRRWVLVFVSVCGAGSWAVPRAEIVEDGKGGLHVKMSGKPFASYVVDQANKPYLWPVYGPSGKAMTRAYPMRRDDHEAGTQRDHVHHRGILFGHESIGGAGWKFPSKWDADAEGREVRGGGDTWHERLTFEEFLSAPKTAMMGRIRLQYLGGIRHVGYKRREVLDGRVVVAAECEYLDRTGTRYLVEVRTMTFREGNGSRMIDFDQEFRAPDGPIRFDDRKDAGLSIRVPASMAVDSGMGGRVVNAEGVMDKEAWSKRSVWCDYNGLVEGERSGIAILNHPSSHGHPTRWHVRTYGLFSANAFMVDGAVDLARGQVMRLHHRFIFHLGDEKEAGIADRYREYAAEAR